MKEGARKWYLRHADSYLKASAGRRLASHTAAEIAPWMSELGRIDRMPAWPFAQALDTVRYLLHTRQGARSGRRRLDVLARIGEGAPVDSSDDRPEHGAAAFVAATGVDALAVAIGTSHGACKFTRPPAGEILAIGRIAEIHRRIPATHLVMHGSSSVPQEWLAIFREFGGEIDPTWACRSRRSSRASSTACAR